MTFFSSTELPTTQFSPTSAEPRTNAQCRTSVPAPMMHGAPRYAVGATVAVRCTHTCGATSAYCSGSSFGPRARIMFLMPPSASQGQVKPLR